jgi:hypothetical protein
MSRLREQDSVPGAGNRGKYNARSDLATESRMTTHRTTDYYTRTANTRSQRYESKANKQADSMTTRATNAACDGTLYTHTHAHMSRHHNSSREAQERNNRTESALSRHKRDTPNRHFPHFPRFPAWKRGNLGNEESAQ